MCTKCVVCMISHLFLSVANINACKEKKTCDLYIVSPNDRRFSSSSSFDSHSFSFLKEAFSIKPSFSFVQQNIIYFYYICVCVWWACMCALKVVMFKHTNYKKPNVLYSSVHILYTPLFIQFTRIPYIILFCMYRACMRIAYMLMYNGVSLVSFSLLLLLFLFFLLKNVLLAKQLLCAVYSSSIRSSRKALVCVYYWHKGEWWYCSIQLSNTHTPSTMFVYLVRIIVFRWESSVGGGRQEKFQQTIHQKNRQMYRNFLFFGNH